MGSITNKEAVEEIVRTVSRSGIKIMGDNYIGFKFIGAGSLFWNDLLLHLYDEGADISDVMNEQWLSVNGIHYFAYDTLKWMD
jgi:hypothetical protein